MNELLTPVEMALADALAIKSGVSGIVLMQSAGRAVFERATGLVEAGRRVLVLCGTGNNGGDGFVAACLLREAGYGVEVALAGDPDKLKGDAGIAYQRMLESGIVPVDAFCCRPEKAGLIVDALLGAGLDRPVTGKLGALIEAVNASGVKVLAVDLPSGINGATGSAMGVAIVAQHTVTFFRKKPGHVLYPGRGHCGEVTLAQIGIDDHVLQEVRPQIVENTPALWGREFPAAAATGHKYDRGHALVVSGPPFRTGAARLSAKAALRAGAGLVTMASPPAAMAENAAHLTAVMLREMADAEGLSNILADRRFNAILAGPGGGVDLAMRDTVQAMLGSGRACVLDADALTAFGDNREMLFSQIRVAGGEVVLTPHGGEFSRLFGETNGDRLGAARLAAGKCGATIILKGADTVIAATDGRAAINTNAPPWLATAGSGDVLAGIVCGLLAQGMNGFDAACAAVWIHGAAAQEFGPGLIAEDIEKYMPAAFRELNSCITQL